MSNIAEGFGRFHKKEFIRFLDIAQGSAVELESQLYLTLDLGYIDKNLFNEISISISSTQQTILGLIRYLRNFSTDTKQVNESEVEYSVTNSDDFLKVLPEEFISITQEE